ncbi:anti-sigma F factor antagonist [Aneurinibacillus tyrosinisolvens]|jgi:stage II sporulation protein AA (anti-sigma F factor antagonist)|uniref:anti-sigma F factor antagonist n=1 Tax=Aneurinibacillus tyrosinisolvens TaxID=1443435 RepID=UPI00063F943A|nr:anti-sigma F factor antagonist [Aneurinibacillus tyrosinisolvens]
MSLRVDMETIGEVLIVRLDGELDHHTADKLRVEMEQHIQQADIHHILLSLAHLDFMDSSGLGVILGRYKQITARGGDMVVCSINPVIYRLFELSGLFKIIKIKESEQEALLVLGVA